SSESPKRQLAACFLADGWPRSRPVIDEVLAELSHDGRADFFKAIASRRPASSEIARIFRGHADPAMCALALSFAVVHDSRGGWVIDPTPLRETLASDGDLLVRRAAIRMAGFIGDHGDGVLRETLLKERDPALLREAIEARVLWFDPWWPKSFE